MFPEHTTRMRTSEVYSPPMSAATFTDRLQQGPPLMLDGGLATELERRGASLDGHLWSARLLRDDPELIAAVHRDYAIAGADVVTTASYQASLEGFSRAGVKQADALALIQRSVELARASGAPFVAGSIGSYGATLPNGAEYRGDYTLTLDEYVSFHAPRVEALLDAGVDVIAAETLPVVDEAVALAALVQELGGVLWLSFTCRDERCVASGTPIEIAAALAQQASAVVAVGVNCVHPALVEPLLVRMATTTSKPLVAYPNRGESWDAEQRMHTPSSNEIDLPALFPRWARAGARLIGGCCRTTPDDIARMGAALTAR